MRLERDKAHCQKCGKDAPAHEVFPCVGCKLNCCRSCLDPLSHVGQSDRCHECAALHRQEEINDRMKRMGKWRER